MTTAELLTETRRVGIVIRSEGGRLQVDASIGVLTPPLRRELAVRKAELLDVLWRLEAMRATVGRRPLAVARIEAQGGLASCFSCGDRLDHPEGYGRCAPCDVAADLFYSEQEVVALRDDASGRAPSPSSAPSCGGCWMRTQRIRGTTVLARTAGTRCMCSSPRRSVDRAMRSARLFLRRGGMRRCDGLRTWRKLQPGRSCCGGMTRGVWTDDAADDQAPVGREEIGAN